MNEIAEVKPSAIVDLDEETKRIEFEAKLLDYNVKQAQHLCKSSMVPGQYRNQVANCLFAIQLGRSVGFDPVQSLQTIAVVNGKASLYGDAMLAVVRASGKCEYVMEEQWDDAAKCTTLRKGEKEPVSRTFTVEMAKTAGLWGRKGPWSDYPHRMLQMRARSWCLRDVYADCLMGLASAEEQRDVRDVGMGGVVTSEEVKAEEPYFVAEVTPTFQEYVEQIEQCDDMAELIQLKDQIVAEEAFNESQLEALRNSYRTQRNFIKQEQEHHASDNADRKSG